MIPRIVITGAPASGKTNFIRCLQNRESYSKYLFFDELARSLLAENPIYRHHWHDFHREIYARQLERESQANGRPFITDRGTIDAFAFHPETMDAVNTTLEQEYKRYSLVIQLGTAAALGEDIYRTDDIRRESGTEAMHIERALIRVWDGHPKYHFVAPQINIEKKFLRALEIISNETVDFVNI